MDLFNKTNLKFLALYTSQYLPLGFFFGAIPAILGSNGVSMKVIGSIYMLGLFWVIKFLWAPFIDNHTILKKTTHYKSWLYIIQILLSLSTFICSFFPITDNFIISLCLIACINLFSSMQDICVDGLVLNNVDENKIEYTNSIQSIGTFLGSMLGLVLPLISYEIYTWKVTLLILSFFTFLPVFILFYFKEKEKINIGDRYSYRKMFLFLKQKDVINILIIVLPAFWIVEGTFGLIQQLLLKYNWSLIDIVISQNIIASIFGIIASIIAGSLINKFGKNYSYKFISILIFIDIILMINYENYFNNHLLVTTFLSYNFFCLGLFMTVYYTYIMANSSKEYAASQINIQHGFLLFLSLIFRKIIFDTTAEEGFSFTFKVLALVFCISVLYSFFFFRGKSNEK